MYIWNNINFSLLIASQVQHLLLPSILCQYSQTVVVASATVQLPLHLFSGAVDVFPWLSPTPSADCSEWTGIYTDRGF